MNTRPNRFLSRKWLGLIIVFIVNLIALLGYDVEVDKMALIDAVYLIWMVIEGIIDAVKKT